MVTAERRGLARCLLAPLRPAPSPVRTTPALARASSSVRNQMREAKRRGAEGLRRSDMSGPAPTAEMQAQLESARNKYLLPGTFVRLPFSQWPFNPPTSFFKYLWANLHSLGQNLAMTWGYRVTSIPKGKWRPAFKLQRKTIIPTAVALHRRLNEALAAGDLHALREVCHEPLFDMLSNVIAARKRNEKLSWELVESHSSLLLPRIIFHRVALIPDSRYSQHSAVVRFDTTQKLTKRNVKGGTKAQRRRENMVLMRSVDARGYKTEPWKVWGFEDEMTLQAWETMEKGKKMLERETLMKRAREMGANIRDR